MYINIVFLIFIFIKDNASISEPNLITSAICDRQQDIHEEPPFTDEPKQADEDMQQKREQSHNDPINIMQLVDRNNEESAIVVNDTQDIDYWKNRILYMKSVGHFTIGRIWMECVTPSCFLGLL